MKVDSREYKLLVRHEPFADVEAAVAAVWEEIEEAVETLPLVRTKGQLDERESRTIAFLDTPGRTLRRHGLLLRYRVGDGAVKYTLKCRSEDRYFAAETDVGAADGLGGEEKLEEDIAPPFRCRLSRSCTITAADDSEAAFPAMPESLGDAADLFPILGTLRLDGRPCPPETALAPVNGITVTERVWKGGKVVFEAMDMEAYDDKAGLALILWSRGESGRPAIAELSYRIKWAEERFGRELAMAARSFYELLQRLDCARRAGMTKTEYVYRDASRE
ncbi:MAG TPA: hypothetical protein VKE40_17590 [Gemmataceae bacterium]|nr:hypothetical protein [Gemmataceae bacterium]